MTTLTLLLQLLFIVFNAFNAKEKEVFNSLFSTRKPKDGWAGLSSGLKSVVKGTAAGVASLVGQPMVGAKQGGALFLLSKFPIAETNTRR